MPYRLNELIVVSEVIAGEAIVINLNTGTYYSMQGSASYIWEQVTSGADLDNIANALAQIEGAETSLEQVVQEFVDHLLKEELIRSEEVVAAPGTQAILPARYTSPQLNIFTDMQSLLLLDPIHQVDNAGWPHSS